MWLSPEREREREYIQINRKREIKSENKGLHLDPNERLVERVRSVTRLSLYVVIKKKKKKRKREKKGGRRKKKKYKYIEDKALNGKKQNEQETKKERKGEIKEEKE